MNKKLKITIGLFFTLLLIAEVFLRVYFGFCDTVLMEEDKDFEYIQVPNQQRFRFRNHISYNAQSMRSNEVDATAVKILGFGDSILNGGVLTDQDSLATTILSASLSRIQNRKVQFLNISAGSWGPDNCFAYLKKYGHFNANQIFLVVSSHDAYDNMDFKKIVGVNESFPSKQYAFAIQELLERYLLPRLGFTSENSSGDPSVLGINKQQDGSKFNSGFSSFLAYSETHNIRLTIYLHAELSELKNGHYNAQGQEIIQFAETHHIPLIKELDSDMTPADFRDFIHLNESGQRKLARIILKYCLN